MKWLWWILGLGAVGLLVWKWWQGFQSRLAVTKSFFSTAEEILQNVNVLSQNQVNSLPTIFQPAAQKVTNQIVAANNATISKLKTQELEAEIKDLF